MADKWKLENLPDLTGKVIIVTGANSGTGLGASRAFAAKGAKVIMACRNEEKAKIAMEDIRKRSPNADIEYMHLDLNDLSSVRKFVDEFKSKHDSLNYLVNNAGLMFTGDVKTSDGFGMQIGVNHLGHFALTGLLMDYIVKTKDSRVVTMSSSAHTMSSAIDMDKLFLEGNYSPMQAYAQSKLANLLFAFELQRKFEENNIDIISVGSDPGWTATSLQTTGANMGGNRLLKWFMKFGNVIFGMNIDQGSLSLQRGVGDPNLRGSEYLSPKGFMGMRGSPGDKETAKLARDEQMAKDLWKKSEELTGVSFQFK